MQTFIPRRALLIMTGMDLDKFQSRQRRDQLPSTLTMQDGSAFDGRGGYPLSDALLITLADGLTDLGYTPSRSKKMATGFDVVRGLNAALKSRMGGASGVFVVLVMWTEGSGFEPSIAYGSNLLQAIQRAQDIVIIARLEKVHSVVSLDLTGRIDRIHAGFDMLGLEVEALN